MIHFVRDRGVSESAVQIGPDRGVVGASGQLADMVDMVDQRVERDQPAIVADAPFAAEEFVPGNDADNAVPLDHQADRFVMQRALIWTAVQQFGAAAVAGDDGSFAACQRLIGAFFIHVRNVENQAAIRHDVQQFEPFGRKAVARILPCAAAKSAAAPNRPDDPQPGFDIFIQIAEGAQPFRAFHQQDQADRRGFALLRIVQLGDLFLPVGSAAQQLEFSVGIVVPALIKIELRPDSAMKFVRRSEFDPETRVARPDRDLFGENGREDDPDSRLTVFRISQGDLAIRIARLDRARFSDRSLVIAVVEERFVGDILMGVNDPSHAGNYTANERKMDRLNGAENEAPSARAFPGINDPAARNRGVKIGFQIRKQVALRVKMKDGGKGVGAGAGGAAADG